MIPWAEGCQQNENKTVNFFGKVYGFVLLK